MKTPRKMKVEIEINEYLDQETMRQMAEDAFRDAVRRELSRESEVQRILSNISYDIVQQAVNEVVPRYKDIIVENVKKQLDDFHASYYIFRRKDAWEKENGVGTDILNEEVRAEKDKIVQKVKDAIDSFDARALVADVFRAEIKDAAEKLGTLSDRLFYLAAEKEERE